MISYCVFDGFVACRFGAWAIVAHEQNGWTALIYAARYRHADCVGLLLDADADKNAKSYVRESLFFHVFVLDVLD